MLHIVNRGKQRSWVISANSRQYNNIFPHRKIGDMDRLRLMRLMTGMHAIRDPFLRLTARQRGFEPRISILPMIPPWLAYQAKLMRTYNVPAPKIDWDQLERTAEAIQPQITFRVSGCSGDNRAYEIGRFITPPGQVGLIKSIQTAITFEPNDVEWQRGDPQWMSRILAVNTGEVSVSWALMIESLSPANSNPAGFRQRAIGIPAQWVMELPGALHNDFSMPWSDMLFLWGHDHAVHWRCPANSIVSLWCMKFETTAADGVRDIGGMMKGFTQIAASQRTYENFALGWGY